MKEDLKIIKHRRLPTFESLLIRIIFSAFLTALCSQARIQAQTITIKFNRLSIDEGLSNSYVTCILQDNKGFMWFGTQDGLNKYDGYKFKIYKHDPSNVNSLPDNYIRSIVETKDGVLWIGMESGGLSKFDPTTETFIHYKHEPDNPNSLSHNSIRVVYSDPDASENILWIGTNGGGLDKFDPITNTFTHHTHDPNNTNSLSNNFIRAIHKDKTSDLWVGTLNGLNRLVLSQNPDTERSEEEGEDKRSNPKNENWIRYYHDPANPYSLSGSDVYSILEDHNGVLWLGTFYGINRFDDKEKETFIRYQEDVYPGFEGQDVQTMWEDATGMLWIGTFHGLKSFDRKEKRFTNYKHDSGNPRSLSENNVKTIYEDRSGLLWFGTRGGGLSILNRRAEEFLHYAHNPNNVNSLSHPSVRGIYEDQNGILWVGGYGGLNRINRKTGRFTHYRASDTDSHQLNTDLIYVIIGDTDNEDILWIGSEGDGLYKFFKNNGRVTHYLMDFQHPDVDYLRGSRFVYDIYMDQEGVLWIATDGGLNLLDKATDEITVYKHDPDEPFSLSSDKTRVIYEDHKGKLWIGTEAGGLNRFDRLTEQFTRFQYGPAHPLTSLSNNRIKSIYEDQTGTLWIGTNGGGLNRFDRETETFKHYTEKDGLPNDVIYGILEDENGNLWLSTNRGLSRFNPETGEFRNYDVNDGLQGNEFNTASYFKSRSGEMFFGGINGFTAFYPMDVKDDPYIPPIVITDFQIFNESVPIGLAVDGRLILQKHISKSDEITLTYKDDVFSFEFAALSYTSPGKNKYAYKMEGFDKDWVYTDAAKRFATYTHLEPGDYRFRVKGSNHDGIWNEAGTSLKVTILPPWYKTWWAYTIYLILFLTTGPSLFYWRINQLKKESERQREIIANLKKIDELKAETLKSHEKYRTIVETSHDLIWTTDPKGTFTFINPRVSEILGRNVDGIIGTDSANFIHPDDLATARQHFLKVIHKGEAQTCELRIKSKKGAYITLLVTEVPIIENYSVLGVMAFGLDITERKLAVEALRERETRYRMIHNSAFDGLVTVDSEGIISEVNPRAEEIFGYGSGELVGAELICLIPESYRHQHLAGMKRFRDNGKGKVQGKILELEGLRKNGDVFPMEIVINSFNIDREIFILGAIRDITERKQIEKRIIDYQKKLQSLASELSLAEERERKRIATELHDRIAQSLAFTKIKLGALRERVSSTEAMYIVGELHETFEQLIQDTRSLTFELASPILYELGLEKAIEWLAGQIHKESGLSIDFKSDEQEKPLTEDVRITLFQAVREAMINVVKHAKAQNVTVSVEKVDNNILIEVVDDGIGFDVAETIAPDTQKSGLGLFSIRERIKYLGGEFEIYSRPDFGTRVTLKAPLSEEKA